MFDILCILQGFVVTVFLYFSFVFWLWLAYYGGFSFSSPIPSLFPPYAELYGQSQTFFISVMKEISYVSFYFYGFMLYIYLLLLSIWSFSGACFVAGIQLFFFPYGNFFSHWFGIVLLTYINIFLYTVILYNFLFSFIALSSFVKTLRFWEFVCFKVWKGYFPFTDQLSVFHTVPISYESQHQHFHF